MKRVSRLASLILIALLALSGVGQAQVFEQPQLGPFGAPPQQYYGGAMTQNQLEEIYHSIWAQIGNMYFNTDALEDWAAWEHKYDGMMTDEADLQRAIKTMVESLGDQWTRYITVNEQIVNRQQAMFGYVSLGIFLKQAEDGRFQIDFIEWGSAAQESALRRHDYVISIDGQSLASLSKIEAEELLKAREGSVVTIEYESNGTIGSVSLRAVPPVKESVSARVLGDGTLYVRFPSFSSPQMTADLVRALTAAGVQHQAAVRSIVLDLRGNPGGEFQEALKVASIFMEKGVIVRSKTRNGRIVSDQSYTVISPLAHTVAGMVAAQKLFFQSLLTAPMVVLVDANTASAAEIVTGALKDNKRATVIGETTYGKGVGYVTGRGPTGGVITITGLEYLTPSGFNLARKGLAPDISVEQPRDARNDVQLIRALEHLSR